MGGYRSRRRELRRHHGGQGFSGCVGGGSDAGRLPHHRRGSPRGGQSTGALEPPSRRDRPHQLPPLSVALAAAVVRPHHRGTPARPRPLPRARRGQLRRRICDHQLGGTKGAPGARPPPAAGPRLPGRREPGRRSGHRPVGSPPPQQRKRRRPHRRGDARPAVPARGLRPLRAERSHVPPARWRRREGPAVRRFTPRAIRRAHPSGPRPSARRTASSLTWSPRADVLPFPASRRISTPGATPGGRTRWSWRAGRRSTPSWWGRVGPATSSR